MMGIVRNDGKKADPASPAKHVKSGQCGEGCGSLSMHSSIVFTAVIRTVGLTATDSNPALPANKAKTNGSPKWALLLFANNVTKRTWVLIHLRQEAFQTSQNRD